MTAHITPFPGQGPARRALTDPKTSAEIRAIAADMVGDVAPHDITMVARGADWTEPPPRVAYRCEPDDDNRTFVTVDCAAHTSRHGMARRQGA